MHPYNELNGQIQDASVEGVIAAVQVGHGLLMECCGRFYGDPHSERAFGHVTSVAL